MQEEEVPAWWWPVTTLAGSAGLIAVGTVIAWQELNAAPQWGEWDILYTIDDSFRRTIMWGDINDLIFRLKDAATSVGKTCVIEDYRLLRERPEEPRRPEEFVRGKMHSSSSTDLKEWVITLPTRIRPIGKFTYRGKTVYLIKSLRRSPAFSEGGRIVIDKEFYDFASPELRELVLEHEFLHIKYPEKTEEEIWRLTKDFGPALRERMIRLWVDMVVDRLKENPELIEETMKAWGDFSYILKERLRPEEPRLQGLEMHTPQISNKLLTFEELKKSGFFYIPYEEVDVGIRDFVRKINELPYAVTVGSCEGHTYEELLRRPLERWTPDLLKIEYPQGYAPAYVTLYVTSNKRLDFWNWLKNVVDMEQVTIHMEPVKGNRFERWEPTRRVEYTSDKVFDVSINSKGLHMPLRNDNPEMSGAQSMGSNPAALHGNKIKCAECGFESEDTRKFRSTILKEEKARILCLNCYKRLYGSNPTRADRVWSEAEKKLRGHGYMITRETLDDILPEWTEEVKGYRTFGQQINYVCHEASEIEEVKRRLGRYVEPRYAMEKGLITREDLLKVHLKADKLFPTEWMESNLSNVKRELDERANPSTLIPYWVLPVAFTLILAGACFCRLGRDPIRR